MHHVRSGLSLAELWEQLWRERTPPRPLPEVEDGPPVSPHAMTRLLGDGWLRDGDLVTYRDVVGVLNAAGHVVVDGRDAGSVKQWIFAVAKADTMYTTREAPLSWAAVWHKRTGLTLLQLWRQWWNRRPTIRLPPAVADGPEPERFSMDKMKREGLWAPGHAVMYRGLPAVLDERGYPLVEGNSLGNVYAFTRAVAKAVATLKLPVTTAMDISPDGRRCVVLTYGPAFEYTRKAGETWKEAFARAPRMLSTPARQQGESICYGRDGKTLYLTSEKLPAPLWELRARD